MAKKYFLFDCETGGLDPSFSLLTLSGVVLNQQYEVLDSIDLAIKPSSGRYVLSSKAMEINKINIATHDAVAITESEAAVELGIFLAKHSDSGRSRLVPAGHNVRLDLNFVEKLLPDFGRYVVHRSHDTAAIASFCQDFGLIPESCNLSLPALCSHLNIDFTGIHNAKVDIELTRQVMKGLFDLLIDYGSSCQ
jgi:DNA polymerase III alpha subunit (gram-positive type)